MTNAVTPELQQKIAQWKAKLAELNKRNRLLYFQKDKLPTTEIRIPASQVFEKLAVKSESISDSELETDDIEALLLKKNLKKLRKDANLIFKEKGVNSLFVTLGIITWSSKDKPREPIISPLFLIPIEVYKPSRKEEYELRTTDESVLLNPALALKLNLDFGITLPEEIDADSDLSYEELLDRVRCNSDITKPQRQWKVEETAYIGLFPRAKASMIKDLDNREMIAAHPILRGFANDRIAYESSIVESIKANELDEKVEPNKVFQILEADSSQQEVIEAAKAGISYIVQGPPGTGKSQTIANIVAELIGQKKKVLIVAEKPVALEVIFDRFKKYQLEDFCLNFADKEVSNKNTFAKFINKTRTQLEQREEQQESDNFFYDLIEFRKDLNQHPENLHRKQQPIDKSAFDLYGDILKLEREEVPTLNFTIRNINTWSTVKLSQAKNLLEQLGQFLHFFRGEQATVWAKSRLTTLDYHAREEIYEGIEQLYEQIRLVKVSRNELAKLFNIENPRTLTELEKLIAAVTHVADVPIENHRRRTELDALIANVAQVADVPKVPQNWLRGRNLPLLQELFCELKNDHELETELTRYLSSKYSSELLSQNLSAILARFRSWGLFRLLQHRYWQDKKQIIKYRKIKGWVSDSQLKLDLKQAIQLQNIRRKLIDTKYRPRIAFENFFIRYQPDFFSIKQSLNWLEELQQYHLSEDRVLTVIYSENGRQEILEILDNLNWENTTKNIEYGFEFLRNYFVYPEKLINESSGYLQNIPLEKIESFLDAAANELDLFREWLDYQNNIGKLNEMGLEAFIEKLRDANIPPGYWSSVFEKGLYYHWLQYIYDNSYELRSFNSKIHEGKIQKFCKLDTQQQEFAKNKLRQLHCFAWRQWSDEPSVIPIIAILNQESQKPKKHKEIRQFITEANELLLALKPCWLMSPLAVSEYIYPQAIPFDVVIFDEASQIRTEDAVSSIMRAKQVIVVGDKQQMPPSSLFSSLTSDDEEEDEEEEIYESLLAECGKFMRDFTLKWHYRSQDESLIDFSNNKFYDSKLITFPNPVKDASRGVHFCYVEGAEYSRGAKKRQNIVEAQKVAELALLHVQENSDQSLGIIAFSKHQAEAIQEQIDRLSAKNPELAEFCQDGSNDFFLKNLENVQGDERDVIILSFGYGKDSEGKFSQQFGSLNWVGGERRLNVAITRAKNKLVLVVSITADLLSGDKSQGVRLFKEYFEYVQRANQEIDGNSEDNTSRFPSPLIEDIYYALQQQGYKVETEIGSSGYPIDLAVVKQHDSNNKEFLLGIECDALTYYKYSTARDRDRLRRQVLEKNLKWEIYRIWSKEWYENKEAQIQLLVKRLKQLGVQR